MGTGTLQRQDPSSSGTARLVPGSCQETGTQPLLVGLTYMCRCCPLRTLRPSPRGLRSRHRLRSLKPAFPGSGSRGRRWRALQGVWPGRRLRPQGLKAPQESQREGADQWAPGSPPRSLAELAAVAAPSFPRRPPPARRPGPRQLQTPPRTRTLLLPPGDGASGGPR